MTTPWPPPTRGRYRAGDVDRQEALSRLGDHFAEGRLDQDEFDERSTRALHAVHLDELDALFVDLPGSPAAARAGRSSARAGRSRPGGPPLRGRPRRPPIGVVLVALVLAVTLVVATRGFVLLPLLAVLWFAGGGCGRARWEHRACGQPGMRRSTAA